MFPLVLITLEALRVNAMWAKVTTVKPHSLEWPRIENWFKYILIGFSGSLPQPLVAPL